MPSVHGGEIVASVIPSAPLGTDAAADRLGLGAPTEAEPFGAATGRRFRFELAAHPGSPAQARRLTRARLTGWEVCEDTCDTAALVISELVTNAIVHTASSRVVCELHDHDDLVRIAVRDEGCAPGQPTAAGQRGEEEHGRGLLLVDALCHAWGAHENGPGLLVWAELPRQADTPGVPAEPRNDLGWGARPKPGPADDGTDDSDGSDGDGNSGTSGHSGQSDPSGHSGEDGSSGTAERANRHHTDQRHTAGGERA
ncbi:ATP-binding protein [Streptomyces griseosporeus]|uniref:ATP-binding protein n=1 Tax=Streptomyces griseosporeus TaxID=1910 RepID=A0ABV3KST1_STRGS|nr:ATP-binding protein [Streptomyces actuosus]